jgi:hypothetical protein
LSDPHILGDTEQRLATVTPEPPIIPTAKRVTPKGSAQRSFFYTKVIVPFKDLTTFWSETSEDLARPSDTANTILDTSKRIWAAGLGALSFHTAIDLYSLSYNIQPELKPIDNLYSVAVAIAVVVYWVTLSCMLFSQYNRKADFFHIFSRLILI